MNEPIWKLMPRYLPQEEQVVWREWPDGRQESCFVSVIKTDLSEGAELLDAEGNTMSTEQVAEFLKTLP